MNLPSGQGWKYGPRGVMRYVDPSTKALDVGLPTSQEDQCGKPMGPGVSSSVLADWTSALGDQGISGWPR